MLKLVVLVTGVKLDALGSVSLSVTAYPTIPLASSVAVIFMLFVVAVAPVTDWRFYDTIYTERFMRTPQQNEDGYNCSSAINAIPNLKGRLLIMAGTADDNVHISNTYQYCSELTAQHKICDMMVYPNMNHSINGCDVRSILYKRILDHFDTYLKL